MLRGGPDVSWEYLQYIFGTYNEQVPDGLFYRTSVSCPRWFGNNRPAILIVPEMAKPTNLVGGIETTGRRIILLHPQHLDQLQEECRGRCRLEEWVPTYE